ncbi:MAG TPA: WD40 repeat domain-containing protein [Caulifigura sp.]|nr:WD40 repeat domain-containing protein [Caulifigura sp.]
MNRTTQLLVAACLTAALIGSAEPALGQGLPVLKIPAAVYEIGDDGTGWKKVFTPGDFVRIGSLRLSPDGTRMCFDGLKAGESWSDARLLSCRPDGSDLKEHGKGAMPNLSPDGRRISFCDYDQYAVRILNLTDGAQTTLESGWGVQWSPVGNQVAYVVNNASIVIRDVDLGEKRSLFPAGQSPYQSIAYNMAWSHDGKQLAIQGTRPDGIKEIAVVESQGAEFGFKVVTSIRSASNFLAFHPGGRKIAYQSYLTGNRCSQLFIVDLDKPAEPKPLPGQPVDFDNVSACWIEGGAKLRVISWQR